MNITPIPLEITDIKDSADLLHLIENIKNTQRPLIIKQKSIPIAIVSPVQTEETDTSKEKLNEPSDITALLEMSGTIEDSQDVSSNKKKYLY